MFFKYNEHMDTYLFIIWPKALFAKEKIIKDIAENFKIIYHSTIHWTAANYENNLKALYGHKIPDVKDKISCIGKGPFELIVFADDKPTYDYRGNANDTIYCNTKVFDKKALYRKWTCGAFRVHGSSNSDEFNHDMAVLLGPDYQMILKDKDIHLDNKAITGFKDEEDFKRTMMMFGDNIIINKTIIAKYSTDIRMFLGNCDYEILGIKEKEIPELAIDEYEHYLMIKDNPAILDQYLKDHGLAKEEKISTMTAMPSTSFIKRFKRELKLFLFKLRNR